MAKADLLLFVEIPTMFQRDGIAKWWGVVLAVIRALLVLQQPGETRHNPTFRLG